MTDVAIVGGGVAGLTAACYLAREGASVTLYEKAPSLGGRATTQTHDGYSFNRGIHALYTGGAASEVLEELGVQYSGSSPGQAYLLNEGKFHIAPVDALTMLRTGAFGFADKLELMRFFTSLPGIDAHEFAHTSVEQWLNDNIRRPQVHQFMTAFAYTFVYSTALDLISAELFISKFQLVLKNPVVYIDGGWQTLVQGLRDLAERSGTRIVSGTRVEAVQHENGFVQGVILRDGKRVEAQSVIVALAPKDAVKLVNHEPLREIVDDLIPAQVACLDVALSRLPDSQHTIVQDMDGPRFMSTQSLYSRVAPDNGALIYTFKQLDPRHQSDPHKDERDLEDLLDRAQPGWREVLVKRQFLPRIDAVGMLPTASGGGYAGRPQPEVPGIENLYLVGDWIGSGFLSDPSFGSARQVARTILEQERQPLAYEQK